jgi:hypothetical protein
MRCPRMIKLRVLSFSQIPMGQQMQMRFRSKEWTSSKEARLSSQTYSPIETSCQHAK